MSKPQRKTKKEPPKIHVCRACGSAFNRPYRLRQHEKTHEKVKQFVCGELNCDKSYFNKSHLDRHILSVHKEPEVNVIYSCPQCMKVFANRQNLKRHIKLYHGRRSNFTCDVCWKDFIKKHQLRAHMYVHTFVKSFSCDHCSSEFITLLEKKKHLKHHKIYNCGMCEMTFNQWSKHMEHKKMMHQEYYCDDCGRKFNKRACIVRHMKIHNTRYTPTFYPCKYINCDRVYTRSNSLKQHINVKHLKVKHECEICFAKLSSKAKLLTHLGAHRKSKECFVQPTKDMGRMLRRDKGAPKISTALRIAGLTIDPENKSIKGTLKNIADSKNEGIVSADAKSCQDNMPADWATEQNLLEMQYQSNSESEQNDIADSTSEQNGFADSTSEQNGFADSKCEHNGIADLKPEQNGFTDTTTESYNDIEVTDQKLHAPLETYQYLKPGYREHSMQHI